MIPNILAERYATESMKSIWSPEGKVRLDRELWIAVMKSQRDLGLDIPEEAIVAYESVIDQVDMASIDARERVTRHDVLRSGGMRAYPQGNDQSRSDRKR